MALELNGTTGVSLVQDGVVTAADLASGAITSGALPAGSVIQVPTQALTYTQFTTTSTSFADWTGMSVTITPSSTSSRILIFANCNGIFTGVATDNPLLRILRDSTVVGVMSDYASNGPSGNNGCGTVSLMLEDSPNTTSAVTYKIQYRSDNGGLVYFNVNDSGSAQLLAESTNSTLTLMEIAG